MSSLTDVIGIRVGHDHAIGDGWLTGVTVVLPPEGTLGAVDVRGAAPASLQTPALHTRSAAPLPQAIVFTGGSSYGLIAAHGVQKRLAEEGLGYYVGPKPQHVVPLVSASAIYDLGRGGRFDATPTIEMGYRAADNAIHSGDWATVARGNVGAGAGAAVLNERYKSGVGTASVTVLLSGDTPITVAALVVVNAFGAPILGGTPLGGPDVPDDGGHPGFPPFNTTLVVVATDAELDQGILHHTASVAHDGIARAIDPVHTLADGDIVYTLATGRVRVPGTEHRFSRSHLWRDNVISIQAAAARVVHAAILDGLQTAEHVTTPSFDLPPYPGFADGR